MPTNLLESFKRMRARWARRRHAADTYAALSTLDTRTLRDIGLHRSELLSVAAEIVGDADRTRARRFA
jgi:uncharacterized protein YjiS (DUF1127 family)